MKRVLVLSSADTSYTITANESFIHDLNNELSGEIDLTTKHYNDISLFMNEDNLLAWDESTGERLDSYDMVYFKSYYRFAEQAVSIAEYLEFHNIPFISSELREYISFSKLSQYARMACSGMPIPDTLFMPTHLLASRWHKIESLLGVPFICKAADGKGGELNFLVEEKKQLQLIITQHKEVNFVCQQFIENDFDLRVLVVGESIRLIIKRQRKNDDTHLNNTSQGASAALMEVKSLNNATAALALDATRLFKREIAGVDLFSRRRDGKVYLLEVNASPQVGTGAFREEKIELYKNFFQSELS